MMPKLTLQFEGRVLREFEVGSSLTIGRLPDNTIVIDNPAVSGHHAHVFCDGTKVILEDLRSTNGTYVNEQYVLRQVLRHGDVILVGKHTLAFEQTADATVATTPAGLSGLGDTVYLDTKQHRALLATLRQAKAQADKAAGVRPTVSVPTQRQRLGVLRVVEGETESAEYDLAAHTSLIGKSSTALVRLRGWFKPDVAVAIARNGDSYVATRLGGKNFVNGEPLRDRRELKAGDVLRVSGVTLEFGLKDGSFAEPAPVRERSFSSTRIMSSGERAATFRALT
jgi:pSer/pThr/pTyr-binding forkhead associated (FHA) protein